MRELYVQHLAQVRTLIRFRPDLDTLELPYKEVLESPREYAERLRSFLGMDLDVDRMAGVVDGSLYRNRKKVRTV